MKNLLLILFALTLGGLVQAQNVNIPDENLKAALLAHDPVIDTNNDQEIQVSEAEAVVGSLNLASKGISNMTGIEAFVNITTLYASGNSIESIDLSFNTKLATLYIYSNSLVTLDLSSNEDIATVHCFTNNISNFTLPADPSNLRTLNIGNNPFTGSFDFSSYTSLIYLGVFTGGICTLDVSMLSNLTTLSVGNNNLELLDVSMLTKLTSFYATNNNLTSLDVSMLPNLTSLDVEGNDLTLLNANNGGQFYSLKAQDNLNLECISVFDTDNPTTSILEIDEGVSFEQDCTNPTIEFLDSQLESALLAHSPAIDVNGNGVIQEQEAADYSGALNLADAGIKNATGIEFFVSATSINLDNNEILSLNLNQNTALTSLSATNNNMTILQIKNGNNSNFTSLNLTGNSLTCINVDDPTYATNNWTGTPGGVDYSTDCAVNFGAANLKANIISLGHDTNSDGEIQISEAEAVNTSLVINNSLNSMVGIEAFKNCTGLVVSNNSGLVDLNVTANTELTSLVAKSNRIATLDLSLNAKLTNIDVFSNRLQSLDIRNGNNDIITNFAAQNNNYFNGPLTCVNVDDVEYFESNFSLRVDEGVFYDTNCSDPMVDIPDANFLTALISHSPAIDLDSDGAIRESEAEAFGGAMDVSSNSIADLTGIAYFVNLSGLNVDNNQLTALDVSLNEALMSFSADNNLLTSLNVANRNNENLATFSITGNTSLTCVRVDDPAYATANWSDFDGEVTFSRYCDPDEFVYIPDTQLFSIFQSSDVNADEKITFAEAEAFTDNVSIHSGVLDLAGLEAFVNVQNITYSATAADHLDVSTITGLKSLTISSSADLETLDLGDNQAFETLSVADIDLNGIDLSAFSDLTFLYLKNCNLTTLNIGSANALTYLNLSKNSLTALELSENTNLEQLYLSDNPITALDLANNTVLREIDISLTDITTIDVTDLDDLEDFRVESGSLTSLDVSQNTKLNLLYASEYNSEGNENEPTVYGALTQVSLPTGPTLQDVDLSGNQISAIDLHGMTNPLLDVDLDWNGLREVSVQGISGANANISLGNNDIEQINLAAVTGEDAFVSLKNNALTQVALSGINRVDLTGNPDLTCAQVFDVTYAEDTFDYDEGLSFSTNCPETGTDFLAFSFEEQTGVAVIDVVNHTVTIEVELETDLSALTPTFTLSAEATADPASGVVQDFTNSVTYTITAESGLTQDWTVTVSNEPNQVPTDITLSSSSIAENNEEEDVVGSLSTTDADENSTHTYSLVTGAGDDDNADFEIVDDQLKTKAVFDFETQTSYSIRVQTNDGQGGVFSKAFTISILDVDENVVSAIDDSNAPWEIYPNPATDWIKLNGNFSSNAIIRLYDLGGNELITSRISNGERLSLQMIEAGLYLISVSDEDITTTTKILIH